VAKWEQREATLREDHGWRAKPGNVVFVANRGAVHFEVPREWVVEPIGTTPAIYDKAPPDDDCRLQLSVFPLPPGIDWTELPLAPMLEQVLADAPDDDDHDPTAQRGETTAFTKRGIEFAWTDTSFIDKTEQRPARSRTLIARANDVQILITFDFWEDDATRVLPVWNGVLRSLRLGEYVDDPLRGPRRPPWKDKGVGRPRRPRR
jgi:hypothetical protein